MNKRVWLSENCSAVERERERNTECQRKEGKEEDTKEMKELMYISLCTEQRSRQECVITYQFNV